MTSDPRTRRATGVRLADGRALAAELTILATGAWTPALADLRGVAAARAQCVAYVPVSRDEQAALAACPVHFNVGSGMFLFPPSRGEIKVARHAYGYANPVRVAAPYGAPEADELPPPRETAGAAPGSASGTDGQNTIVVSAPVFPPDLPAHDAEDLKSFLQTALPGLHDVSTRPHKGRLCWYLDTRSADFLVCHYPLPSVASAATDGASGAACGGRGPSEASEANNEPTDNEHGDPRDTAGRTHEAATPTPTPTTPSGLFLATAGSGHAFKFLPVLGARCVDVLLDGLRALDGQARDAADREGEDGVEPGAPATTADWTRRWGWPGRRGRRRRAGELDGGSDRGGGGSGSGDDGDVWCEDGSRAGERGRMLWGGAGAGAVG